MELTEAEKMTPERLQQVEDYAGYFFTPDEIAVIMGMREQWVRYQMISEHQTDFKRAVLKGQLIAQAEIRKSIFTLAKSGSAPAQVLAVEIMKDFQLKQITV